METFGEWLRGQRTARKLTREEFATRVGCSVAMLRKIENGERRPSGQIAELLANCLDIPLEARSIFVRVARGEWRVDRLRAGSKPVAGPGVSSPKTNLPIFPTPVIGREREVEQLSALLCKPDCRLLTLVGPGGIGKTRLAVEAAANTQDAFADGVYFVSLAPVNATSFIVPMIADALGFTFQSASRTDPKTQLFNYLRDKQVLLLADNLEHLLSVPGIEVLSEFLANAPQVKLLATSRESLSLRDEWVFEVHGLPVPENLQTEGSAQDTSVELFLQRARRAHVEFNATSEDVPAILHICHLVDGMPLAIELAAAWVRTLTCAEIAREIERSLDFLSISARDVPVRHRSMRAVFDHSWKLLAAEEKQALARLSVFRGGIRREAAEQVAEAPLRVLSALVTKSFIRRSGTGRYDLHELIRLFAGEHLSERRQEQTTTQARHSSYYLSYFGQADGPLRSSAQRETLAELTTEMDNFRSAWDWAVTNCEFELIEQTMRTFWVLYDIHGWLQQGLDMLADAVSAFERAHEGSPPNRTNQIALAHILTSQAVLATRLGQQEQGQAVLERSLEILRPLDEPRVLVETITFLGLVMEFTGNYLKASEFYREGLEIAATVGDRWYAALCRLLLAGEGSLRLPTGKPEDSHERLKSVVADWRVIGDPRLTAIALQNLSWMAVRLGLFDEAREALEESVLLNTSIGDRWNLGFAYRGLGLIAQAQGEHLQAVDMFRKSLDMFKEIGARQDRARVLVELSSSIFAQGNDADAERGWREALHLTMETQGTFVALEALVGIATLKAKQENFEEAFKLSLIVLSHPAGLQETKGRADRLRADLEAQFTSTQIKAIHAQGREKSFEAAVEDLLRSSPAL
jgi:predicted ATPase/transcriptional regulator with XRE-family HTH domain